jgi:recombinational DNA repair ATPase RecF
MVLGASQRVQSVLDRRLLLLLDDPAAELDKESLSRLMEAVEALDCQVIATALEPEAAAFPESRRLFHVEQGRLRRLS